MLPERVVETNFGDFVAEAFLNSGKLFMEQKGIDMPLVAVENAGGIRGSLPFGTVRKKDFVTAFPFSNTLYLKEITSKILYDMMDISLSLCAGMNDKGMLTQLSNSGGFLQIGGFKIEVDTSVSENRVTSIPLLDENKVLDRNDTETKLMLISNNYIMSGGSGYSMLIDLPKAGELGGDLEEIEAYYRLAYENGLLDNYNREQNRISYIGDYKGTSYDVKFYLSNNGELQKY